MMGWLLGLFRRPPVLQVAALCVRTGPEILLVRSDRGNWILPKGWPMAGKTLAEPAAIEAWEEAGVRGHLHPVALATLHTQKRRRGGAAAACQLVVFRLDVNSISDKYPESATRRRKWVPLSEAAAKADDAAMAQFLQELSQVPLAL